MPTYEYECRACEHIFEVFQSMTAQPIRKCPHCGKLRVKRLIGVGAGFIFKGSGFYETDYKRKPAPVTADKKSEASACVKEKCDSTQAASITKPTVKAKSDSCACA